MVFQVWARGLYSKGQYAVSEEAGSGAALYLFPFQQDKLGIQFLGFFLPRQEVHNASLLRHRILLVLDLDETLVTTKRLAGVQVCICQHSMDAHFLHQSSAWTINQSRSCL